MLLSQQQSDGTYKGPLRTNRDMWKTKTMTIEIRKAARQKAKLRLGMSGPSGSGKTYSALLLAKGIVDGKMEKVAIIDTENGSADLYSHLGDYNVISLQAPYSPERYIEAMSECEKAGMEVVIIDSVTHEWDGKGGLLESNELIAQTRFKGNTWAAWSATTPRHQKFIEMITTASMHVITTARSKTDTIQTEDKKIKKVGLKEIQREGFEYELTLNFTLDRDGHYATASKDRTGIFIDKDPFVINEAIGKMLNDWAEKGIEPIPVPDPKILEQKKQIVSLLKSLNVDMKAGPEAVAKAVLDMTKDDLGDISKYNDIIGKLEVLVDEQKQAKKEKPAETKVAEQTAEVAK